MPIFALDPHYGPKMADTTQPDGRVLPNLQDGENAVEAMYFILSRAVVETMITVGADANISI